MSMNHPLSASSQTSGQSPPTKTDLRQHLTLIVEEAFNRGWLDGHAVASGHHHLTEEQSHQVVEEQTRLVLSAVMAQLSRSDDDAA